METEVAPHVTFNGYWYTVTTPSGNTWSFDPIDQNEADAIDALWAWSRWLDFVKGQKTDE